MVVDDDPAIVEATSLILEEFGYAVDSIIDGEKLYAMTKLPDLLLLDIWMSGQDGRDICRYLKMNPETKHIPVILISASRDLAKSASDAGADDFLSKPFEMQELLEKVEQWV